MNNESLTQTLALIDKANLEDPNIELDDDGNKVAKEFLYSKRMSEALKLFHPNATAHLTIACHAQHIERWKSLRSDYPEGRSGYKKWRAELGLFHATRAADCMLEAGASQEDIDRVKYLVQKRQIKRDEESQILEDVVCLVFLQYYLEPFALKHSEEKLIDIIQKTWAKMSEAGHAAALKLPLPEAMLSLVQKALSA